MKSYSKGKIPQIIFGSKKTNELIHYLLSSNVHKCLIVSDSRMIEHNISIEMLKMLDEAKIAYEIYSEVNSEPTDQMCLEVSHLIKENHYEAVIGLVVEVQMDKKLFNINWYSGQEIKDLHQYGKSGNMMKEEWQRPCLLILIPTTSELSRKPQQVQLFCVLNIN